MLKYTFLVLSIVICNLSYSQIVESVEKLSFESIHSLFLNAENHSDTVYSGIDTIFSKINSEEIMVCIKYENSMKVKTTGYYNNGTKYREIFYTNQKLHGLSSRWYKNGQLEYIIFFENGSIILPEYYWYENGVLEEISYTDPKNINIYFSKKWYENGTLMEENESIDTTELGYIIKNYYESGKLLSFTIANMGIQLHRSYYENGNIAWEGNILNLTFSQVGKWQEWYESKQLKREYYFNDSIPNLREGIWKWWDNNGKLLKEEIYENGELVKTNRYRLLLKKIEN